MDVTPENSNLDLLELSRIIAEKNFKFLTNFFKQDAEELAHDVGDFFDSSRSFQTFLTTLAKNPDQLFKSYNSYWQDSIVLLQEQFKYWQTGTVATISDKRFSSAEWINNPFFRLFCQQYNLTSEHFSILLKSLDYGDHKLARNIQFFATQYLDALSPDNFLHTNPQVIVETIQNGGKNLQRGLLNLVNDFDPDSASLMIKMTDYSQFSVGGNLAATPGSVIFRNDLMELIQYTPQTNKVKAIPLLIIPPWINKYYILDLTIDNSMIRWLVYQGITVFVISWINPDVNQANKGLYDYMNEGPITAIKTIKTQLKLEEVNTLGFCIGGTLLAMLLAYNAAHEDYSVRSATFLATMIDFTDPGDIAVFINEAQIQKLERRMKKKGFLEGHFMTIAFNLLRSKDLIWSFFIKNYLCGKEPVPFATLYWNSDATNMPHMMHSEYLRWMYLHNDLVKPGKICLNGTPLDISKIVTPTFFVGTEKDHIAPWKTVYSGFDLMGGKKHFLLGGSGHIAGIINPPCSEKYGFYSNPNSPKIPEDWLAEASYQKGSWWLEWLSWLNKNSSELITAPDVATLCFKPIIEAPGNYVHKSLM